LEREFTAGKLPLESAKVSHKLRFPKALLHTPVDNSDSIN